MAISTAVIGAVAAVAGTATSIVQGNKARADARAANRAQEQTANEQKAQNAQDRAIAARQQYREERVRRARIMNSATNTGTQDSSGELGALGSLSTAFSVNQGQVEGGYQRGIAIGNSNQSAANSIFAAQKSQANASQAQQYAGLGQSLFSYGLKSYKSSAIPGTTTQPAEGT